MPKETAPDVSNIRRQLQEAEATSGIPPHHPGDGHDHGEGALAYVPAPTLRFDAPKEWEAQPLSTMRKASFLVRSENGETVDISVMSFPGNTGGVAANVNRWRQQVGLAPLDPDRINETVEEHSVRGRKYLLVDIPGIAPQGNSPQRIIGAIHAQDAETWFFKMMGETDLTAAQREPFIQFLESVEFE